MKTKLFAIDLDMTLTKDVCYTPEECRKARPNTKMIECVNELSKKHHIVIHTARRDELMAETHAWLRRHNVLHVGVCNEKRPYDYYVDDKNLSIEEFLDKYSKGSL